MPWIMDHLFVSILEEKQIKKEIGRETYILVVGIHVKSELWDFN